MAKKDAEETPAKDEAKGGKKKLILMVAAGLLVLGGAGWFVFLKPSGDAEAAPPPEPGPVVRMDPISINLADGHYLKVGLALQTTADAAAHGDPDGSKALDIAISTLSNREVRELSSNETREKIKKQLREKIVAAYEDHHTHTSTMMDIYFTEFVMQ